MQFAWKQALACMHYVILRACHISPAVCNGCVHDGLHEFIKKILYMQFSWKQALACIVSSTLRTMIQKCKSSSEFFFFFKLLHQYGDDTGI